MAATYSAPNLPDSSFYDSKKRRINYINNDKYSKNTNLKEERTNWQIITELIKNWKWMKNTCTLSHLCYIEHK